MPRGLKNVARQSLFCSLYKPSEGGAPGHFERHEELVSMVKAEMERQGLECEEKVRVRLHNSINGEIDLLCYDAQGTVYIFECKSYPVSRMSLADIFQLGLYTEAILKGVVPLKVQPLSGRKPRIYSYLVYRDAESSKPYYLRISEDYAEKARSLVRMHAMKGGERKTMLVSSLCWYCAANCPLKVAIHGSQP